VRLSVYLPRNARAPDAGAAAGRRDQVPVARQDRGPQPGLQPLFGRDLAHLGILSEQGRLRSPANRPDSGACAPAKRLIRKMGGSRSAPLLTLLLYALTFAHWMPTARPRREAVPASEFRPGKK
jgi:hypothetical protein